MATKSIVKRGGARISGNPTNYYIGSKKTLPKGFDAFATPKIGFLAGRRVGFNAGVDTGRTQTVKEAIKKAVIHNELKSKNKPKGSYIYKTDIKSTISQRALQQIAKSLNIANFSQAKSTLLPLVLAKEWTKLDAKKVILEA